jgi:hypothetical protein
MRRSRRKRRDDRALDLAFDNAERRRRQDLIGPTRPTPSVGCE